MDSSTMTNSKNSNFFLSSIVCLSFFLFAVPSCSAPPPEKNEAATGSSASIRDYLEIVGSSKGYCLSNDSFLFLSRGTGEVQHIYREQQGKIRALTNGIEPVDTYTVSPDGSHLLFLSSRGGDEQYAITLLTLADNQKKEILANPAVRYDNPFWLDNHRFFYTANEVSPRDFYIYLYDLTTEKKLLLTDRPGTHIVVDAKSADQFLFYTLLSSTVTIPYRYENGKVHKITGARENRFYQPVGYWADGRILVITDEESDVTHLVLIDKKGKRERLFSSSSPVEAALLDRVSRNEAVFCTNEAGWSSCYHLRKGTLRALELGHGVITLNHLADGMLAYTLSQPDAIPHPICHNLRTDKQRSFGITDSHGVPVEQFVSPVVRTVSSFDGEQISFLLYTPPADGSSLPCYCIFPRRPGRTVASIVCPCFPVLSLERICDCVAERTGINRIWTAF